MRGRELTRTKGRDKAQNHCSWTLPKFDRDGHKAIPRKESKRERNGIFGWVVS